MASNTSQHILNTSANLLGFCLFVITSLHLSTKVELSRIDEFTSVVALLLTLSLSLIHISEPTRLRRMSYAVFCLKKKKKTKTINKQRKSIEIHKQTRKMNNNPN